MKKLLVFVNALLLVLGLFGTAIASTVLDFENITFNHASEWISIPNGYGEFNWERVKVFAPGEWNGGVNNDYFSHGVISGTNVATCNTYMWVSLDTDFDFIGAYFSSETSDPTTGVVLTMIGYKNDIQVGSPFSLSISDTPATYINVNLVGIDKLLIQGSNSFMMDNFTFNQTNAVPLPPSFWLLGSGLFGIITSRRKLIKKLL